MSDPLTIRPEPMDPTLKSEIQYHGGVVAGNAIIKIDNTVTDLRLKVLSGGIIGLGIKNYFATKKNIRELKLLRNSISTFRMI